MKYLVACLLSVLVALPVLAHQRGVSYSHWELGETPAVALRLSELELTRIGLHPTRSENYREQVASWALSRLHLGDGGEVCQAGNVTFMQPEPGWLQLQWIWQCSGTDADWRIHSDLFLDVAASHLHFASVEREGLNGELLEAERVLAAGDSSWTISANIEAPSSSWADYVVLGIEHILTGWDHLTFVAALLLMASFRHLLWLVSGFTIGHSVTLALAALGIVKPEAVTVEALIGWSIALLAIENLWLKQRSRWVVMVVVIGTLLPAITGFGQISRIALIGLALFSLTYFLALNQTHRPWRLRGAVTVVFGMIHGFGFAGILASVGLPPATLLPSLLGFNLGVEIGQLLFLCCLFPVVLIIRRWPLIPAIMSSALCACGVYWFVSRGLL